jgi:hypothetical protein
MITPTPAHAPVIPDSLLAKEATDILREHSTDLLFDHSMRVYPFAAEQGRQRKLRFDPELLYVAAAFHDLGLIRKFSSPDVSSRSMAPMPPDSSSTPTTSLKIRCRPFGKQSRCTSPLASRSTCAQKWRSSIQEFFSMCWGWGSISFQWRSASKSSPSTRA